MDQINPVITVCPADRWRGAFEFSDFTLLQCARASRVVATEMVAVAVGWQLYELTRRPASLGFAGLSQFLPGVLLFLVAGHWADRFSRRKILIACFTLYVLGAAMLAMVTFTRHASAWIIYFLLALLGAARAFAGPAAQALTGQVVPAEHFPNAVTWGSMISSSSTILGPALGGVLYELASGATAVYVIAALIQLCALLMTVLIRSTSCEQSEPSLEKAFAGVRYVWRHRLIFACISLDLFAVLLGGAVALLPIFAKDVLHTGPWGLGVLRSAPAVGAVGMAVWLAHNPLKKCAGTKMLICIALFGLGTIIFGLSTRIFISVPALLLIGAVDMVSVIVRGTLTQLATPPGMRGRVSAVSLLFTGTSNQVGQFESGLTAQCFGAVSAVVLGGVGTLLVVANWTWCFPEIANIDNLISTIYSSDV